LKTVLEIRGQDRGVDMLNIAFPLLEQGDFFLIDVKTGDFKSGPAEFDHQREADIAQTDNGNVC
jgi:hypothetical protein